MSIRICILILIVWIASGITFDYFQDHDTYAYYGKAKVIDVHEDMSLIEFRDCNKVKRRQWIEGAHEVGKVVEVSFKYKVRK